jgi:hypothetical protein
MHVIVVPEPTTNAGKAHYELRSSEGEKESLVWEGDRPFFMGPTIVTDSGWVLGCADVATTSGRQSTFHVCALDPAGTIKVDDEIRDPRDGGNRVLNGALVSEHPGRILFRVQLPLPRGGESWCAYDSKSGALVGTFRPDARQENADRLCWIHGTCSLGNQGLVLVHWEKFGEQEPDYFEDATWRTVGSRFALLTSDGAPVWSIDVPSDLGAESYGKYGKLIERLRALECAGILDATHDDRFEIGLIGSGMRVSYSVVKLDDKWVVKEITRTKWSPDPPAKR